MFEAITSNTLFGIVLSLLLFEFGVIIQNKVKSTIANPLIISGILIILILKLTGISYETYNNGARFINMFLAPCTAMLAVNIYTNLNTIKKYLLPILAGTASAAAASMGSIYLLCKLFKLDEEIIRSMLSKSVTTAIALPLATMTGGISSILVTATVFTGILCSVIAPFLVKLFRMKNPVAIGIAIGSSGHAIGTATAIKMGPIQAATSSVAIAMCGLITVLYYAILF